MIISETKGGHACHDECGPPPKPKPGEIYNHVALKAQILAAHPGKKFRTASDCEVRREAGGGRGRGGGFRAGAATGAGGGLWRGCIARCALGYGPLFPSWPWTPVPLLSRRLAVFQCCFSARLPRLSIAPLACSPPPPSSVRTQVISHLYEDHKEGVAAMLDGMFSFVLLDQNSNTFMVARCVGVWLCDVGVCVCFGRRGRVLNVGGGASAGAAWGCELDGMFSFVLLDQNSNTFMIARSALAPLGRVMMPASATHLQSTTSTLQPPPPSDPIGITSLYIGWGRDGATWVASEMKCLKDECVK